MSELSTVQCDRVLGLWLQVHGRRVSTESWERCPRPRRGGGNLPARKVLAVFSKPATYPGFADPPKPRTGSSSPRLHRGEDFDSKKEPRSSDESLYLFPILPLRAFLVSSLSLRVFWTPAWALQIPPHPLSLGAPGQAEAAAPFSWRRPLLSLSLCSFSPL